jgi:hypothetical protein
MSKETRIELAWSNFLQSSAAFNAYLLSERDEPGRRQHLIAEMTAAMDEVLNECGDVPPESMPA